MWLPYRKNTFIKRIKRNLNLPTYNFFKEKIVYQIVDIQNIEDCDKIQFIVQHVRTNTVIEKHPLEIYSDLDFLILFSPYDIKTIIIYSMYQQRNSSVSPIVFEGYDYNTEKEQTVFYNVLTSKRVERR